MNEVERIARLIAAEKMGLIERPAWLASAGRSMARLSHKPRAEIRP